MARVVALSLALASILGGNGAAQELPRLHIVALGMHADRGRVAVGESYHITIHVRVTEKLDRLDELQLPTLTNAIDLGDERRRVDAPGGGTDFYETMTVSSPQVGRAQFSPAYIDAIDPAVGRGMRYSSEPLTVPVVAASQAAVPTPAMPSLLARFDTLLERWGWALAIGAVVLGALWLVARPRAAVPAAPAPAPPVPPPAAPPPPPPRNGLRDAIAALRARPDDAALDRLRIALFACVGVGEGATLVDALRAIDGRRPVLARAMTLAERARFGPSGLRAATIADLEAALDLLERETAIP